MGSIVASIVGSVVSSVISSAIGGEKEKESKPAPAPAPAVKPPQAAKIPDAADTRRSLGAAFPGGTAGGTLLTGAGGVANDELNLGGNTLLGR